MEGVQRACSAGVRDCAAAVDGAAHWYAALSDNERRQAGVPALKARFGLSAKQACEALRQARRIMNGNTS